MSLNSRVQAMLLFTQPMLRKEALNRDEQYWALLLRIENILLYRMHTALQPN